MEVKPIVTLEGHSRAVISVSFAPEGKTLASTSADRTLRLWDITTREECWKFTGKVSGVACSADGQMIACAWTDLQDAWHPASKAKLFDRKTGRELATLEGKDLDGPAGQVVFSPDGKALGLVSGRAYGTKEDKITLWDISTKEVRQTLHGDGMSDIFSVAFYPDGTSMAAGGKGPDEKTPALVLWDVKTGKVTRRFEGHKEVPSNVALSPDGRILAAGGGTTMGRLATELKLWDVKTGERIADLKDLEFPVHRLAFSPNGKVLASSGGSAYSREAELKLWDVTTHKVIARLVGHTDSVNGIAFSRDGTRLASASEDKTIKLWDVSRFVYPDARK
jgi:WD40 repeat protein